MPTTPKGFRHPGTTDTPHGPDQIRFLAEDIDTFMGTPNIQVFTASGTWNKPTGTRAALVRAVGGGGAGGGAVATAAGTASCGGGGTSGAYGESLIQAASLGATETVTVGAAGAGASGAGGGSGGTSSFGSHVSAAGGPGGTSNTANAQWTTSNSAVPSQAITAAIAVEGNAGDIGISHPAGFVQGGGGGAGPWGGAAMAMTATSADGNPAQGYGAGGSGAANGISQAARTGGAGGAGVVIVISYF